MFDASTNWVRLVNLVTMDGPFGFMDLQYIQIHYKVLYPLSKAFQEKRGKILKIFWEAFKFYKTSYSLGLLSYNMMVGCNNHIYIIYHMIVLGWRRSWRSAAGKPGRRCARNARTPRPKWHSTGASVMAALTGRSKSIKVRWGLPLPPIEAPFRG